MKATTLLALALSCALLGGCGAKKVEETPKPVETLGVASNEIFTYDRIDPNKTTLVVSITGSVPIWQVVKRFSALHPDIQVILLDITGGNDAYRPAEEWLERGYRPDVMFFVSNLLPESNSAFADLTNEPSTQRYQTGVLRDHAQNGHVYAQPGPSQINGILCNKTLFDRYGWEVPQSFDQFIALCRKITLDTDGQVRPYSINAKYPLECLSALEGFSYDAILGGVDNRTWLHDYREGKSTMEGHMEPLFTAARRMMEEGLILESDFSASATTRFNDFKDGKIAMVNYNLRQIPQTSGFSFFAIPYPGLDGKQYVSSIPYLWVTVPQKERSEKEKAAVDTFLDFFATEDGQSIFIGNSMMFSNVKGVAVEENEQYPAIIEAVRNGNVFSRDSLNLSVIPTSRYSPMLGIWNALNAMVKGTMDETQATQYVDGGIKKALADDGPPVVKAVSVASEDFTILETSTLLADMLRESAGADIGLMMNNAVYRGNITKEKINYLLPRSFGNGSKLLKAEMTGKQIRSALDAPIEKNCVYALSGLKATVAPWNEVGKKVLSVSLPDGTPLKDDTLYTVAFWDGTVDTQYYDEKSTTSYPGSFTKILTTWLEQHPLIAPDKEQTLTLEW